MIEYIEYVLGFLKLVGLFIAIYCVSFLIRKGWGDAENNTKKVCDTCFRDIKKWNKILEKNKLV